MVDGNSVRPCQPLRDCRVRFCCSLHVFSDVIETAIRYPEIPRRVDRALGGPADPLGDHSQWLGLSEVVFRNPTRAASGSVSNVKGAIAVDTSAQRIVDVFAYRSEGSGV